MEGGINFLKFPLSFYRILCYTLFCNTRYGENIVGMHMEETCIFLRDEIGEKWYDLCDQKRWDKGRI